MITYVRHNLKVPFEYRCFGPKSEETTTRQSEEGDVCPACGKAFAEGDYTTLVPLGPGDDAECREKAQAGRWFNAVAIEVHADCAGVKESDPR